MKLTFAILLGLVLAVPAFARTAEEANGDIFQAEALLVAHQYQAAYDRYHQLNQEFPGDPRVTQGYVRVLTGLKRWDELRAVIAAQRERTHQAILFAPEMVSANRGLGNYPEALDEDLLWWVANPADHNADRMAHILADTLLLESGYSDRAVESVRRMARQAPSHQGLRLFLVEALQRAGRGGEARDEALRYDHDTRSGGQTLMTMARDMAQEEPMEAVKAYETVIREFPQSPSALSARVSRGDLLRGTPRWEEARRDLETLANARGAGQASVEAQILLAEADVAKNPAAARERVRALGTQHPEALFAALRVEAESYLGERNFKAAAVSFTQEAEHAPDITARSQALWDRAESYFYAADFDSANEAYKAMAASNLRDPRARDALTRMLLIGDATSESGDALKNFAQALYGARLAPARADSLLAGVYSAHPRTISGQEAQYQRALLRRRKGDFPGALEIFKLFADTTIASARAQEALYFAAEIHRTRTHDLKAALDLYGTVATRFPDSWLAPDARRWVERLRRETGS